MTSTAVFPQGSNPPSVVRALRVDLQVRRVPDRNQAVPKGQHFVDHPTDWFR